MGEHEKAALPQHGLEAARAEASINNEIRYTGDDTDDEDGEIAAEEPAPAASPLAGRARATVVSTPAPAAAAPAEPAEPTKAYAKVIASLKGASDDIVYSVRKETAESKQTFAEVVDSIAFRYAEYCITAPLLFLAIMCLLVNDAPAWYMASSFF